MASCFLTHGVTCFRMHSFYDDRTTATRNRTAIRGAIQVKKPLNCV